MRTISLLVTTPAILLGMAMPSRSNDSPSGNSYEIGVITHVKVKDYGVTSHFTSGDAAQMTFAAPNGFTYDTGFLPFQNMPGAWYENAQHVATAGISRDALIAAFTLVTGGPSSGYYNFKKIKVVGNVISGRVKGKIVSLDSSIVTKLTYRGKFGGTLD